MKHAVKRLLLCLICFVGVDAATAQQASSDALALAALKVKIGLLTEQLQDEQQQRDADVRQLQQIDEKIAQQAAQLVRTTAAIKAVQISIDQLQTRLLPLRQHLADQRHYLAKQLSTSWRMGRQQFLKLLLKQDDPLRLSRILSYYGYLNRARVAIIEEVRDSYKELQQLDIALLSEQQSLESHLVEQQRLISMLQAAQTEQQQIVDHWNRSIGTNQQRLQQLASDANDLNRLVVSIDKAIPVEFRRLNDSSFAALKGRLVWPVSGTIIKHYGDILSGGVTLDGLVISLPEGQAVRSVHAGTVVFADWLSGYGMLVIVEHDSGYMTLYGYNQQLLKQVGSRVTAGESIALSGRSGGQSGGSLYFAVRRGERVMNPQHWCRAESNGRVG